MEQTPKIIETRNGSGYIWNDHLFKSSEVVYEGDSIWPTGVVDHTSNAKGFQMTSFATSRVYLVREIASFTWSASDLLPASDSVSADVMTAPLRDAAVQFARAILPSGSTERRVFAVHSPGKLDITVDVYVEIESIPAKIQLPRDEPV